MEVATVRIGGPVVLAEDPLEHVDPERAGLVARVIADRPVVVVVSRDRARGRARGHRRRRRARATTRRRGSGSVPSELRSRRSTCLAATYSCVAGAVDPTPSSAQGRATSTEVTSISFPVRTSVSTEPHVAQRKTGSVSSVRSPQRTALDHGGDVVDLECGALERRGEHDHLPAVAERIRHHLAQVPDVDPHAGNPASGRRALRRSARSRCRSPARARPQRIRDATLDRRGCGPRACGRGNATRTTPSTAGERLWSGHGH